MGQALRWPSNRLPICRGAPGNYSEYGDIGKPLRGFATTSPINPGDTNETDTSISIWYLACGRNCGWRSTLKRSALPGWQRIYAMSRRATMSAIGTSAISRDVAICLLLEPKRT
jgi:hypothetical protein